MYGLVASENPRLPFMAVKEAPTPGKILERIRRRNGLSIRQTAKLAGLSHTYVGELEKSPGNLEGLSLGTVEKLARAYSITIDQFSLIARGKLSDQDVVTPAEEALERQAIELTEFEIPTFSAGTGPAWDLVEAEIVKLYLPQLKGLDPAKVFGLWARGDSMSPYLKNGALAVCYRDPGRVKVGEPAAIWFADDGVCIKRFWGEDEEGLLVLGNDNESYERVLHPPLGSRVLASVLFTINF